VTANVFSSFKGNGKTSDQLCKVNDFAEKLTVHEEGPKSR